jgi:hypothetical protein
MVKILVKFVNFDFLEHQYRASTMAPHMEVVNVATSSPIDLFNSVVPALRRQALVTHDADFVAKGLRLDLTFKIDWAFNFDKTKDSSFDGTKDSPSLVHLSHAECADQFEMIERRGFKDILVIN